MAIIEHKQDKEGNRYLVSAYPLEDDKETKVTNQFNKLVYCKYSTTAKFPANAPQGRAYDLLRAAISGGHTSNVACKEDVVKWQQQSGLSFSIRGRDMLTEAPLGRMAAEEKMQRLMNYARKEAARFERTFSAGTPNARAAEAMGTISSIMGAIHKELPLKFRPRLDGQMRYMEVYARLLESGKLRAYGKEKIGALLNHPMMYWDKAKARPWINNYRLQLPAPIQPRRASGRRIQTPADLVKYKLTGLNLTRS